MKNSKTRRLLDYLDSYGSNNSENFEDHIEDPDFHLSDNNELSGISELLDSDNEVQGKILAPDTDTNEQDSILELDSTRL